MPGMFDECDQVEISVTFDWDKNIAEEMAYQWEVIAPVKIGGVAYDDPGGEFIPGKYLKHGYTITSRGCPNKCWFCEAWKNEGNTIRELEIKPGYNVLDNNLLACSRIHQEKVFKMLQAQKEPARFTGGFEAKRFTSYHAEWLTKLRWGVCWFAYDEPDDLEPLIQASKILKEHNLITRSHKMCCYVLIGHPKDTMEEAEKRLIQTIKLGFFPQAMLFNKERKDWIPFASKWANKVIVGCKMKEYNAK
jgi:hypothetical protein